MMFFFMAKPLWANHCQFQVTLEQPETNFNLSSFSSDIKKSMKKQGYQEGIDHPHSLVLKFAKTFDYHSPRKKRALVFLSLFNDDGTLEATTLGSGRNRIRAEAAYSVSEFKSAIKTAISNLAICSKSE